MPKRVTVKLCLAQDPEADAFLSEDPFHLLVGMVLDQQVPLEWAFKAPRELSRRLDAPLHAAALAAMNPEELTALFAAKPSLHRYPAAMSKRVQALATEIAGQYGGDAVKVWKGAATGEELLARVKSLPGFGDQKARIFVALLAKQFGVRPDGWEEASTPYGETGSFRSVADIVDDASLRKVREHKKAMKAAANPVT
ncbi:MAG: HhH-GPD-type base excision DNA repair protein [Acidimicrobiales bacterium]